MFTKILIHIILGELVVYRWKYVVDIKQDIDRYIPWQPISSLLGFPPKESPQSSTPSH